MQHEKPRAAQKAEARAEDERRLARGEEVHNGLFSSLRIVRVEIVERRVKMPKRRASVCNEREVRKHAS